MSVIQNTSGPFCLEIGLVRIQKAATTTWGQVGLISNSCKENNTVVHKMMSKVSELVKFRELEHTPANCEFGNYVHMCLCCQGSCHGTRTSDVCMHVEVCFGAQLPRSPQTFGWHALKFEVPFHLRPSCPNQTS